MIGFVLARRYARAVIDLAREKGVVAEVGSDLARIAALFEESAIVVHAFADPTVAHDVKEKVLEQVLAQGGLQDLTKRFVHILLSRGRVLGIGEIARAYQELADAMANRIRARVVSASALEKSEEERLRAALARISGKEVVLKVEVDEGLLGGLVAYVGSHVYDGSLSNQLQRIRDRLNRGR